MTWSPVQRNSIQGKGRGAKRRDKHGSEIKLSAGVAVWRNPYGRNAP